MYKDILVRFEGGLGDCFLANRFLFAIKDKYPLSKLTIAFDTDGNLLQEQTMKSLWPSTYTNTYTIDKKFNKQFMVTNAQGQTVNYPCHPDNMPINFRENIKTCDKYYNLHIASLNFIRYDFGWLNWYNHFPRPEVVEDCGVQLPSRFILVHFYPRPDASTQLDRDYALKLIVELKKIMPVVAIAQEEHKQWYEGVPDLILTNLTISQIFNVASRSSLCYAADSSIRFIPLHFGIPTFVFSRWCAKPHDIRSINHAHTFRWLLYRHNILPIDYDITKAVKLASNLLQNQAYAIFPEFSDGLEVAIQDLYNF